MNDDRQHQDDEAAEIAQQRSDGNAMLGAGAGIGAFGVISAAVLGAACPLCVVAAPALLGVGAYKRIKARRRARANEDNSASSDVVAEAGSTK